MAWTVGLSCLLKSNKMFFLHFEHSNLHNHLPSESKFHRDRKWDPCWQLHTRLQCLQCGFPMEPSPQSTYHVHAKSHGHSTFSNCALAFLCVRNFRSSEFCCLRSSSEIHEPWLRFFLGFWSFETGESCGASAAAHSVGWKLQKPKSREWNGHLFFVVLGTQSKDIAFWEALKFSMGMSQTTLVGLQPHCQILPAGWLMKLA